MLNSLQAGWPSPPTAPTAGGNQELLLNEGQKTFINNKSVCFFLYREKKAHSTDLTNVRFCEFLHYS